MSPFRKLLALENLKDLCHTRHLYLQMARAELRAGHMMEVERFCQMAEIEQINIDKYEECFPGALT